MLIKFILLRAINGIFNKNKILGIEKWIQKRVSGDGREPDQTGGRADSVPR